MELSPLELYQKAYNLHYKEQKTDQAIGLYEKLLRDHGESDAASYASVQLQTLHPHKHSASKTPKVSTGPNPVVVVLLVINLLALASATVWLFVSLRLIENRQHEQAVLTRALGRITAGNDAEALELLDRLKALVPDDVTAYALASDIYRRNHKYTAARREYELFQRLNPSAPSTGAEISRINSEEDKWIAESKKQQAQKLPQDIVKEAERKTIRRSPARRTRRPDGDEAKPKLLVDPSELQFF